VSDSFYEAFHQSRAPVYLRAVPDHNYPLWESIGESAKKPNNIDCVERTVLCPDADFALGCDPADNRNVIVSEEYSQLLPPSALFITPDSSGQEVKSRFIEEKKSLSLAMGFF